MKSLLFVSVLLACNILYVNCAQKSTNNKNGENTDGPYRISYKKCLESEKPYFLSKIVDTIEYIILKTPPKIIITSIKKIILHDGVIYLTSKGILYQFTRDGNYIGQIGRKGKGPGEYNSVIGFFIDSNKKVIGIFARNKIIYYSLRGDFLYDTYLQYSQIWEKSDSVFWGASNPMGIMKTQLIALNSINDTLASLKNYDIYKNLNGGNLFGVVSKLFRPFYRFNGKQYYKGYEDNDTIWQLTIPNPTIHAIIEMGTYKLPIESRVEYSKINYDKNAHKYVGIPCILGDKHLFYISSEARNSKKISTLYHIYDKISNHGYLVTDGITQGITDDILQGPSFWPIDINDQYYIGTIEAYDFIEKIDKLKVKHIQISKIASQINENSNQLLILCRKI